MKRAIKVSMFSSLVRPKKIVGMLLLLGASAWAYHRFQVWDRTRDVFPEFIDVPAGARAPPTARLLGLTPGTTTLPEFNAWSAAHGLSCSDTSMRALMEKGRQETQAKMKQAEDEGQDPDAVSGASRANYHSKKERNPQVRMACYDADLVKLGDGIDRGPARQATVMAIFDGAALPLRYVGVWRRYFSEQATLEQWKTTTARLETELGPPTKQSASRPVEDDDPLTKPFERMVLVRDEWRFADRRAEVQVINMGPQKGIDFREILEIPWPVRTDGPPAGP